MPAIPAQGSASRAPGQAPAISPAKLTMNRPPDSGRSPQDISPPEGPAMAPRWGVSGRAAFNASRSAVMPGLWPLAASQPQVGNRLQHAQLVGGARAAAHQHQAGVRRGRGVGHGATRLGLRFF